MSALGQGSSPRVVLGIRGFGRGGAERLVHAEAIFLRDQGLDVEVWHQIDGPFGADLEEAGIPVRRIRVPTARRHLRVLARQHGRVVIHTHSPSFGAFLRLGSLGLRGVRTLHTEHNMTTSYRLPTRVLHRLTARRIDALVAVSHAVLDTAPTTRSSRVLYHLDPGSERMQACLEAPPKQGGALRLLCVASLTPKKDHANLFAALELLAGRLEGPLEVDLVGDGPLRDQVTRAAARVDRSHPWLTVRLLGVRDDIPALLAAADALVLPSLSEGLPLIVMEAMAASTPVVATAVGGVPELVEHDRTGLLAEAHDPAALAGALARVLSDSALRTRSAAAGRARVLALVDERWPEAYLDMIVGGGADGPSG